MVFSDNPLLVHLHMNEVVRSVERAKPTWWSGTIVVSAAQGRLKVAVALAQKLPGYDNRIFYLHNFSTVF